MIKLYSYFRSSAAYRVRIALNLKKLPYQIIPIHLIQQGGEQLLPQYLELNPAGLIPTLIEETPTHPEIITQSIAIIEYIEEAYPKPALLPKNIFDKAYVRSLSLSVACDIHPLNNLRVLRHLTQQFHINEEDKNTWYRHWCQQGLMAIEAVLAKENRHGKFCFGDTPTLADCCLIPQVFNAHRFQCDLSVLPTIMNIYETCLSLDEFIQAAPNAQPDFE